MAVPKERLLGRLKAYLTSKAINLSNTRIDESSARLCSLPADDADDAAIDAVIANADVFFPFKDIASGDDRVRTLEAQVKKPDTKTQEQIDAEAKAKADSEALEKAKSGSETPEYIKTLMATIEGLKKDIVEVKTGKVLETKKATAAELFGKSEVLKALKEEVRPNWINRINVDSETSIEDQITALESEYTIIAQSNANSTAYSGSTPNGINPGTKADDALITSVVDSF